jgi:hypothetical protein
MLCRMPARLQRLQQMALSGCQRAQDIIINTQYFFTGDQAHQVASVVPQGLQPAPQQGANRSSRAQCNATSH